MKKAIYGTVSALALVLASHGMALAGGDVSVNAAVAVQVEHSDVSDNIGISGATVDFNKIDDNAFQNAKGAFNVGQNSGANSAMQQGTAIGAVTSKCGCGEDFSANVGLAASALGATVSHNGALNILTGDINLLGDNAFQNARGAMQVAQNSGANSSVQQSMAIATIVGK